jgi:hypothetical protein
LASQNQLVGSGLKDCIDSAKELEVVFVLLSLMISFSVLFYGVDMIRQHHQFSNSDL